MPESAARADPADALRGQHAVVTGAGKGIGAAIADALARAGADLTLMGRDADALAQRRQAIERAHGTRIGCVTIDITDPEGVERGFAEARSTQGPLAILVNNAGAARSAPFKRTDATLWTQMLEVNLNGAYRCTRAALPDMLEAGYGRIVNVASTAGLRGYAYSTAYTAAKHGLVGLTRALALELARSGITVNAVCPGFADTDLTRGAIDTIVARTGRTPEQARAELEAYNPQRRLVQPSEVASAVVWLCRRDSAAVTGQCIVIAGGEVM